MQFEGQELLAIIGATKTPIDVMDSRNQVEDRLSADRAGLRCMSGNYVGIGNKKRIRYIRPLGGACSSPMAQCNFTTRRVRNDKGVLIAPKNVVEHIARFGDAGQ